jgi:hypothetical protein
MRRYCIPKERGKNKRERSESLIGEFEYTKKCDTTMTAKWYKQYCTAGVQKLPCSVYLHTI